MVTKMRAMVIRKIRMDTLVFSLSSLDLHFLSWAAITLIAEFSIHAQIKPKHMSCKLLYTTQLQKIPQDGVQPKI